MIDAKPDELRGFIEEAAGLSKYKERRRETTLRIEHSQDNLARLNDISQEVQQQIERLSVQAEAAEQFRTLKTRIRTTQSQLKALQWQELQAALADAEREVETGVQQLEALHAASLAQQDQQEVLQVAQSQCLLTQERIHNELAQLNQAIAEHLTANAHQQAQLQSWRQQEQEIAQELAQLAGLLEQSTAEQHNRTQALQSLAQAQHTHSQALAQLQANKQLLTDQLEGQQQGLKALEHAILEHQALRMRLLNQQELTAEQLEQAADQLTQRQAALSRLQEMPVAPMTDSRVSPHHVADLEQNVRQLMAEHEALALAQAEVAQELAYHAGRLGRKALGAADHVLAAGGQGPWLDTWAAAEAWLQPWISAQPWQDNWQAASSERTAPLFMIRPQADALGTLRWIASWQEAADRAAALVALDAQPEGVLHP